MTLPTPDFSQLAGHTTPWLLNLRQQAYENFVAQGWPTPRMEAWKYTNIAKVIQEKPHEISVRTDFNPTQTLEVFSTGRHRRTTMEDRSERGLLALPDGVTATPLAVALQNDDGNLQNLLSQNTNGLSALNTAFMQTGYVIDIADNTKVDMPLHLITHTPAQATDAYVRNIVRVGKHASVTLLEDYVANHNAAQRTISFTTVLVDDDGQIEHLRLQQENAESLHLGHTNVQLNRGAVYNANMLDMGGRMARHELSMDLNGPEARNHIHNIVLAHEKQHIETAVFINHNQPHCTSGVCTRNVADDHAQAVFQGKFYVAQEAQLTDAEMLCKNLLLSEASRASAKPELEIYADDVKCAHGATTGKLDDDALFYLQARGLNEKSAKALLTLGFVTNLIETIEHACIHDVFLNEIEAWMAAHV